VADFPSDTVIEKEQSNLTAWHVGYHTPARQNLNPGTPIFDPGAPKFTPWHTEY